MDLSTIMTKINSHKYVACKQFLKDVDLITNNCLEYNPDRDTYDRLLRNRACELRDTAHAMIYADLDPEFEKMCEEINESRQKRSELRNLFMFKQKCFLSLFFLKFYLQYSPKVLGHFVYF